MRSSRQKLVSLISLTQSSHNGLNFSSCKVGTSRYFLLNTFIKNFQVISPCNWRYKTDWDKLSTGWQNKCKQRNVDSRVDCENATVLGWKRYASFTKKNTDSFQTALLNKNINKIWKSVVGAFWLIINHEFIKEAKTPQLSLKIWSFEALFWE